MGDLIKVDFKLGKKMETIKHVKIWTCDYCLESYPYTKGASNNVPSSTSQTKKTYICKNCVDALHELMGDAD